MELVKPAIGLMFWMFVSFGIVLFILKKFAWKPILTMIKERETSIDDALKSAKKAREEMMFLKTSNEKILTDAKIERDKLMKEAQELKAVILAEAKAKASVETEKIIAQARGNIQNEKLAALTELKNQVATLSIEIAEKILKQELKEGDKQKNLVNSLLQDVNLN